MAIVQLFNLAQMGTSTTGTGASLTLTTAITGFLTFAQAGVTDGLTVRYQIRDGANSEVGYGVYTLSTLNLTRNVINSTNGNSRISLTANAQISIGALAEDFRQIYLDDGTVSLPSLTFLADPDSGLYRIGANNIGIAVNGAKVLDVSAGGLSVVGSLGVGIAPNNPFQVKLATDRNIAFTYLNGVPQIVGINDANNAYEPVYIDGSSLIFNSFSGGNAGFGTTTPQVPVDIAAAGGLLVRGSLGAVASIAGLYFGWDGTSSYITSVSPSVGGKALIVRGFPLIFQNSNTNAEMGRFDISNNFQVAASISPTTALGAIPAVDMSSPGISIANGANVVLSSLRGLIVVAENTAIGDSAIYLCSQNTVTLVSSVGGAGWVVPTTTPAAGHYCVASDGTNYRLYNNRGGASTFTAFQVKLA